MITDLGFAIAGFFVGAIFSPILILEDAALSPDITNALTNVGQFVSLMNTLFPFGTLLICVGAIVALEFAIFVYKGIMWLVKKIPTIN